MELNRRQFVVLSGAALTAPAPGQTRVPWYQKMRRCGQINFNERDPESLDINAWLDYWMSLKLDALLLNAGGIVAFYPTQIPYHHRSVFLGSRDLFGDFAKAARARDLRVIARMDCNWAYEEALRGHPEWFERDEKGAPRPHAESAWLFRTCMFSPYFTEQFTSILREVNSLYEVDGFFTNGWPSTGRPLVCWCESCRKLGDRQGPGYAAQHLRRVTEVWKLWDRTAKEKKWDSVYVGNLGGGIRAVLDLKRIGEVAGWFNADHQGRSGATPIWDCAQQGRVAQAVMQGGAITNVTGAYANTRPLWRHTAKARAEARMWLAQTVASGMTPWYHWLGGEPEDQRWRATGRDFYQWIAKHERHFVNRRPVANIGVVFAQRTHAWYNPPGGGDATEFLQGMYYALLEGRFLFDFVHEDDLAPQTLAKYAALVLPNAALLSDQQCRQLREYVRGGGSMLATFETSRYDESGRERAEPGLAELFGTRVAGGVEGPNGNSYYARIEAPHEIWREFHDTRLLPGAEYRVRVRAQSAPLLSVVPPYPAFPPEMVFPRTPRTDEAAIAITESGGRVVYFPGDVDRSFWRSGNPDLGLLLASALRWATRGRAPVSVAGEGVAELFAWETEPGFAVHVLNYNNPNMLRGWFRRNYAIGPQRVRMELPEGTRIGRVRALAAEADLSYRQNGSVVEFVIPRVEDYEIAALLRA
jgi:Hypothetical glycosyl hydrolase 6/Beta-galactosidase trimerisation domain